MDENGRLQSGRIREPVVLCVEQQQQHPVFVELCLRKDQLSKFKRINILFRPLLLNSRVAVEALLCS